MDTKNRFGLVELIASILGVLAYYLLSVYQYVLFDGGLKIFEKFIFMPGLMLALVATVFGPVVGFAAGFIGQLLSNMYVYNGTQEIDLLIAVIIGVFMGLAKNHLKVNKGGFGAPEAITFNVLHLATLIFTLVMVRPLLYLIFGGKFFPYSLEVGVDVVAGNGIIIILLGTPLLMLTSKIMGRINVIATLRGYRR